MKVIINDVGIKAISVVVPKQKRGCEDLAKIIGEKGARGPGAGTTADI